MVRTWVPPGSPWVPTWSPRGSHLATTWSSRGSWCPSEKHVGTTWGPRGDHVGTRWGPGGARWGAGGAKWGPRGDHQVGTRWRPAGAGTRWGPGVGTRWGPGGDQVGTTWGPPRGDQVWTSRSGDQVGTRWGYNGDQVGPGRDPVGTRTNGPAMKHGHSWQDKAARSEAILISREAAVCTHQPADKSLRRECECHALKQRQTPHCDRPVSKSRQHREIAKSWIAPTKLRHPGLVCDDTPAF